MRRNPVTLLCVAAIVASGLVVGGAAPALAAPSWTVVPSPSPAGPTHGQLAAVACTSSANCLAVGHTGFLTLGERWNGTSWSRVATPDFDWSSGAGETYLAGIACAGVTSCFAVGFGSNSNRGGAGPLIQRWNGSKWSSIAAPGFGTNAALNAVACASATACHAVGSNDAALFATRWNGSSWSKVTIPKPAGATHANLSGIKCTSATSCFAVGSYRGSVATRTLVERWNGTKWSIASSPNPAGATSSRLDGVACPATTTCHAVGTYTTNTHQQRTLAERWNGTKWSIVPSPSPTGHPTLSSVVCRSVSICTAVGTKGTTTLVERWNGTKWAIVASPNPSGSTNSALRSVSCPSSTVCFATGTAAFPGSANPRVFNERWNGSVWKVQAGPVRASVSPLHGVACATSAPCIAAGTSEPTSPGDIVPPQQWNGTTWTAAITPLPVGATASALNDVACGSPTFCVAVGDATVGTKKTLIEQWSGTNWTVVPVAVAGSLSGVACADATHCAAVGTGGGQTLVEQWNGSSWTTASGAVSGALDSVSCGDTSNCMAVGVINLPNSPALRWNGATWTAVNGVVPAGSDHEITPTGVACSTAADCVLVGHYRDFFDRPIVYAGRWDGTAWSQVTMPDTAFGSLPEDVACASSTDCTAVGSHFQGHSGEVTWVEHWNGTAWARVVSPNPPSVSPPGAGLENVTCTGAGSCFAVGWWINDANTRTLIERFA